MNKKERKTYLETKLRNLKRKYAKLLQHSSLIEETLEISAEIKEIETQINNLQ